MAGRPAFTVCLKHDQPWWFMSIHEMWAGKMWAEEVRDPSIIQQAALNVLLIDAVVRRSVFMQYSFSTYAVLTQYSSSA